jgi:hypothetical protein
VKQSNNTRLALFIVLFLSIVFLAFAFLRAGSYAPTLRAAETQQSIESHLATALQTSAFTPKRVVASSSKSASPSSSPESLSSKTNSGTTLANTGSGNVFGLFVAAAFLGSILHYAYRKRWSTIEY